MNPKHTKLEKKLQHRYSYLLYILAIYTGYRAKELSSIRWNLLELSGDYPSATVLAGYTKNDKESTLPLQRNVAALFRQNFVEGDFSENDKIFPKFNKGKGAVMLRSDLESVDIPYQDDAGRYADFHALRHTFASVLDKAELTMKERQTLLRHSTITLTMDVYTHIGLFDERQGVDKMPVLPSIDGDERNIQSSKAVALKTGSDNQPVETAQNGQKKLTPKLTPFLTPTPLFAQEDKKSRQS